ncbi:MAG: DUF1289 domain-containing protein [Caulobacterales bacterium]
MREPAISTPCVSICEIEPATEMCAGCGRTLAEIAAWVRLTEPQRRAIMETLPARLALVRQKGKI